MPKTTSQARTGDAAPGGWRVHRPDHFSTYVPRELIRRLKVIAAIRDVPLWNIVTDALEQYLVRFEDEHGALPRLESPTGDATGG